MLLRDDARAEPFTRDEDDVRELAVTLHYPIERGSDAPPAPYGDIATWGITFSEVLPDDAKSQAVLGEEIAPSDEGFPLILYSPGFEYGLSDTNTFAIHELVSHGYVVGAVDHPYVSLAMRLEDDRIARFGADLQAVAMPEDVASEDDVYAMPTVVDDLRFALDRVLELSDSDEAWRDRIDAAHIGAFGHSYGGAAAAELLRSDARVSAALDYDGRFHPDVVEHGVAGPLLLVSIEGRITRDPPPNDNYDYRAVLARAQPGYFAELEGAIHGTFQADIGVLFKQRDGRTHREATGDIDADLALEILSALNLAFFDAELRDGSSDALLEVEQRYSQAHVGVAE
jgi:dienelactone hydrolase